MFPAADATARAAVDSERRPSDFPHHLAESASWCRNRTNARLTAENQTRGLWPMIRLARPCTASRLRLPGLARPDNQAACVPEPVFRCLHPPGPRWWGPALTAFTVTPRRASGSREMEYFRRSRPWTRHRAISVSMGPTCTTSFMTGVVEPLFCVCGHSRITRSPHQCPGIVPRQAVPRRDVDVGLCALDSCRSTPFPPPKFPSHIQGAAAFGVGCQGSEWPLSPGSWSMPVLATSISTGISRGPLLT
jgi:hypothetical protein